MTALCCWFGAQGLQFSGWSGPGLAVMAPDTTCCLNPSSAGSSPKPAEPDVLSPQPPATIGMGGPTSAPRPPASEAAAAKGRRSPLGKGARGGQAGGGPAAAAAEVEQGGLVAVPLEVRPAVQLPVLACTGVWGGAMAWLGAGRRNRCWGLAGCKLPCQPRHLFARSHIYRHPLYCSQSCLSACHCRSRRRRCAGWMPCGMACMTLTYPAPAHPRWADVDCALLLCTLCSLLHTVTLLLCALSLLNPL